jgi:putative lipoic acid-binding regulatory protein
MKLAIVKIEHPSSFSLKFKGLEEDSFVDTVNSLKQTCFWMYWDREAKVWRGSTTNFVQTMRFCLDIFDTSQILVQWDNSSTGTDKSPSQLRML